MLNSDSESLHSFGEVGVMSLNTIPATATDYTTALAELTRQLAGGEWSASFYPDGGGGNDKIRFCTAGIHAIFTSPDDSPASSSSLYVANTGYVSQRPTESHKIHCTLNMYGALKGTNNVGEMTALLKSLTLIADLLDNGIVFKDVFIYQDSTYVINCYLDWMHNWSRNNWKRRTGEPVANVEILKELMEVKKRLKFKTQKVTLKWVKGHSSNIGNNKADAICSISYKYPVEVVTDEGIFKYDILSSEEPITDKTIVDAISVQALTEQTESIPTAEGLVNPLLRQTAYYFLTGQQYNNAPERKFMMANLYKDSTFGERHPQNGYSLIVTKDRSLVLDTVEKHVNSINAPGQICEVLLKKIFSAKVHKELVATRQFDFKKQLSANAICNNLVFNDQPLARIANPPLRAMVTFPYYNVLDNILTQFRNGNFATSPDVSITDITDQFYEIDDTKKKPVCKVVPTFTTAEKIFKVKIKPWRSNPKQITLPLYVGSDIPIRNIIGALSSFNPKVSAIAVKESEDAIRFFTVFESTCGIGIFGSLHSNFIKVNP